MKNILAWVASCFVFTSHAQDVDSTQKKLHYVGSIHISFVYGFCAPAVFGELGLMVNRKATARHHFVGRAAFASIETNRWMRHFDDKAARVVAPKAGIWWSAATSGLGIGLSAINYINIDEPKSLLVFRPEAGLAMGHVMLTYGYNMASRRNLADVCTLNHQLSLKLAIGLIDLTR